MIITFEGQCMRRRRTRSIKKKHFIYEWHNIAAANKRMEKCNFLSVFSGLAIKVVSFVNSYYAKFCKIVGHLSTLDDTTRRKEPRFVGYLQWLAQKQILSSFLLRLHICFGLLCWLSGYFFGQIHILALNKQEKWRFMVPKMVRCSNSQIEIFHLCDNSFCCFFFGFYDIDEDEITNKKSHFLPFFLH